MGLDMSHGAWHGASPRGRSPALQARGAVARERAREDGVHRLDFRRRAASRRPSAASASTGGAIPAVDLSQIRTSRSAPIEHAHAF